MTRYSRGKHAFGYCDRTGQRWPLEELRYEYVQGVKTGLRVGPDVWDDDHPQNWFGKLNIAADPQALKDPRPDLSQLESRRMFAYDPVGSIAVLTLMGTVSTTDPDVGGFDNGFSNGFSI